MVRTSDIDSGGGDSIAPPFARREQFEWIRGAGGATKRASAFREQ